MKRRELPITCGEERPVSGALIAHSQPASGLSDTLSQAAFARDDAGFFASAKASSMCCWPCLHMPIGYSDKLIYSYKSQLLAEEEDQKNMGMRDRDVILETESRLPGKE